MGRYPAPTAIDVTAEPINSTTDTHNLQEKQEVSPAHVSPSATSPGADPTSHWAPTPPHTGRRLASQE
eukprot:4219450-Prymnesium_polylepis.1